MTNIIKSNKKLFTGGKQSTGGVGLQDLTFSGQWHTTPTSATRTTTTATNGVVWWFPYPIGKDRVVTDIAADISTGAAASNIRLALYSDNGSGRPGTLIEESGNISAVASGILNYTFASPITLSSSNKFYWLAFQASSASIGIRYGNGILSVPPSSSAFVGVCTLGQAFGAFPASAAGYSENTSGATFQLMLKVQ